MPFDAITCTVLEYCTAHPPAPEDSWYGIWITILTTLFPSAQGYIVTPQRPLTDEPFCHIPDFIIEVVKLSVAPLTFRTVLIMKIKTPSSGSSEFKPFSGSSIDKVMLHLQTLLTQNCTGSAQSDLIGGTENGIIMGRI
jgi:hypothetical protein